MTDVSIEKYSLKAGRKLLLNDTKLVISANTRYGLVGPNGCGKSTLLGDIDRIVPDSLLVKQEVPSSDHSVEREVASLDQRLLNYLDETDEEFDHSFNPGYEMSQIRRILAGLGFDPEMQQRATKSFSGGWRMRISIAKALYQQPPLLLLDEPTNHLDLSSVIWLTNYMSEWKHGLILVSHDRHFLNEVVTAIMAISQQGLRTYRSKESNRDIYFKYKQTELQERTKIEREWKDWKKRVTKLRKQGKKNEEIEKIRKDEDIIEPDKPYCPRIDFEDSTELRGNIITCKEVTYTYPETDTPVLKNIDLAFDMDSRAVIVGANGSGKSTFLKLLGGALEMRDSDLGEIQVNRQLKVGYFHQHFDDILDYDMTPIEFISTNIAGSNVGRIRRELGKIGLNGAQHTIKIRELSGGQRARVALVHIMLQKPHFLILDEPTNHLDIETNDALIDAINSFNGGLILVTHNSDLITATECQIYCCKNNTITAYHGDYENYSDEVMKEVDAVIV